MNIQSLLDEAAAQNSESTEFNAWSHSLLARFSVKPYSTLEGFKTERFNYPDGRGHDFRLYPHKQVAEETISLARHAWQAVGGDQDPARGLYCAAMASIEYVRAQLQSVCWIGSRLNIYQAFRPEAARRFVDNVQAIDWHDSKAVLSANFQALSFLGIVESSADNLYNWTATLNRPAVSFESLAHQFTDVDMKAPNSEEIMSGAALLAVDTALASTDWQQSMGLMAFAANAMWQAGFQSGWDGRDEMFREDAKHAGKRGGTQRHQTSRELKLWALAEAVSLGGSDIAIARKLAQQIPLHLRNASVDPERLIYEALRTDRKGSRQGE